VNHARQSGPAISFAGVTKRYGSVLALDQVSFAIQPGEMVALLGPNGAGKSTTVDVLLGLRHPDGGTARVLGQGGGLLIPGSQLPAGLRHAAAVLPSRRLADLARAVAAGHNPPLVAVAVLAAWTLAAAGAALALRRRDGGA
jgi:ABC-2 type transport system ATP-binding protein